MAPSDDPQEVAAQFWAQMLGFEIAKDGPEPGSPLWGMQLVRRLALAPPVTPEVARTLVGEYVGARWSYCFPELDELWGNPRERQSSHSHPDVRERIEAAKRDDDASDPGPGA